MAEDITTNIDSLLLWSARHKHVIHTHSHEWLPVGMKKAWASVSLLDNSLRSNTNNNTHPKNAAMAFQRVRTKKSWDGGEGMHTITIPLTEHNGAPWRLYVVAHTMVGKQQFSHADQKQRPKQTMQHVANTSVHCLCKCMRACVCTHTHTHTHTHT